MSNTGCVYHGSSSGAEAVVVISSCVLWQVIVNYNFIYWTDLCMRHMGKRHPQLIPLPNTFPYTFRGVRAPSCTS